MVMWGGSTGGFFVMATLIQRHKDFKAAVCFYGGSRADLTTRYAYFQNEEYGWMGQMIGGTPLSNPKPYYDRLGHTLRANVSNGGDVPLR